MKKLYFDLWSSKLSSSEFSCISLLGISKHCWDSVFRWYHSKLISCTQKSDQVRGKGMHWLPVMGKILGNTSPGSNVKLILNQTSLHFSESIFSKLRMNKIWERRESQLQGGDGCLVFKHGTETRKSSALLPTGPGNGWMSGEDASAPCACRLWFMCTRASICDGPTCCVPAAISALLLLCQQMKPWTPWPDPLVLVYLYQQF